MNPPIGVSRDDYASMAHLARSLYADGLDPHQVLQRCYGVRFPEEVFVIADAEPDLVRLLVRFTNQPWQLAIPPERGGPTTKPDSMAEEEREIFAHDPDLLPLARCLHLYVGHGGWVLCYSISELRAGRSTIIGYRKELSEDVEVTRRGDSLLAVLHEHHTAYAAWVEQAWEESAYSHDTLVDEDQLAVSRLFLQRVDTLRRRLAARTDD